MGALKAVTFRKQLTTHYSLDIKKSVWSIYEVFSKGGKITIINNSRFRLRSLEKNVHVFNVGQVVNGFLTNRSGLKLKKTLSKPDLVIFLGVPNLVLQEVCSLGVPIVLVDKIRTINPFNSEYQIPLCIVDYKTFVFVNFLLGGFLEVPYSTNSY